MSDPQASTVRYAQRTARSRFYAATELGLARQEVRRQQDESERLAIAGDEAGYRASSAKSARLIDALDHADGAHAHRPPMFDACAACDAEQAALLGGFLGMVCP